MPSRRSNHKGNPIQKWTAREHGRMADEANGADGFSPAGTKESFEIFSRILHPMPFKEAFEFISKCGLPMMFGLILNIPDRILHSGDANTESSITLLPFNGTMFAKRIVNPLGRVPF